MNYFGVHNHTHYSNIRLIDCINRPKDLINKAIELGLSGIAITDHECLSSHMEVNQYAKELKETNPDFTIALGNEIYLTETRESGQKYYHFILIAKDALGHKALRTMSSTAWRNMYNDRRMDRVPLLKTELVEIMKKYKGHVIATSACIGGELSASALEMQTAQDAGDNTTAKAKYKQIVDFVEFCKNIFGDDFYIECAPSTNQQQIMVNKKLLGIANKFNIPLVVGTDAHFLRAEDRPIHKAYLTSKEGDREVDDFYEFAYLMSADEVSELLKLSFDNKTIENILNNTNLIKNKIEFYDLSRKQIIPKVKVKNYNKNNIKTDLSKWEVLNELNNSKIDQERYWVNKCFEGLQEKDLLNDKYIDRLEIEADVIKDIGNKLDDCLFAYFNTFAHYISLFWECGSIVGPGRGSSTGFLSNYLMGITQLDPIRWDLPYWRFLNKERAELPDIDIDLAPSRRPAIFDAIRKERGELGLVQVATFGTEGTKSAVQTACRGYRSVMFPNGIDIDQSLYMSSLIPQERGFLWPLKDVVNGNIDLDRKPIPEFIKEVKKYEGLLDIMMSIEGLINKRSSHASGVILYGEDPFDTASFMRTPSGDLITCYDLHLAESAGDTKYDFLVTEASDKIIACYNLLKDDKVIEDIPLHEFYNKYLHPEVMDTTKDIIWDKLGKGEILDVFQFSTGMGLNIAKKLKPRNMLEMTSASALMRLMAEKGQESPQDRYVKIKNKPDIFEKEMVKYKLTDKQRKAFHKHCDKYYGTVPLQEQMMEILMDQDIAGFTLAEANSARKVVAKKQMSKIPQLKEQLYKKVNNKLYADYIWEVAVAPSLGYAFSKNHSLPYSFVGVQEIVLATQFNPIYWNTACLIVNSGSLEDNSTEELVDIYEVEKDEMTHGTTYEDLPDRSGKIKRASATDYGKVARAIGDIQKAGIKVSLADINRSDFSFRPDVENNQILFGLKGMLNVGDEVVVDIIKNRPYTSPEDFVNRVEPNKQAMIALIKGGAFDNMMDRMECMRWYIGTTCDQKKRLTLQNLASLMEHRLIPDEYKEQKRIYEFTRYLKKICKGSAEEYHIDERAIKFLTEIYRDGLIEQNDKGKFVLNKKNWDIVYQETQNIFREFINNNKDKLLYQLNSMLYQEEWNKYALGTLSAWEMEVLCFYYHEHELAHLNTDKYGVEDFFALSFEPVVEKTFTSRNGVKVNKLELHKIAGTVIAKNKIRHTVSLLTTSGVVDVKFRKEYFALFDKQVSVRGLDNVKHVAEKSWFNRGNKLMVQGFRSGDEFITKKYSSSPGHQLYKIVAIDSNGDIQLQSERVKGEMEDE